MSGSIPTTPGKFYLGDLNSEIQGAFNESVASMEAKVPFNLGDKFCDNPNTVGQYAFYHLDNLGLVFNPLAYVKDPEKLANKEQTLLNAINELPTLAQHTPAA